MRVNERWLPEDERAEAFGRADLERAPLLWRGRFDPERIEELRQGQTTLNDKHIREGVVVGSTGEQAKRITELGDAVRPLLKAHSDARSEDNTSELQSLLRISSAVHCL